MKSNTILEQYRHETLLVYDKGMCFVRLMQLYLQVALYYASCFTKVWKWGEFSCLYKDSESHNISINLVAQTTYGICWVVQSKLYQKLAVLNRFLNYHILDTVQCFSLCYSKKIKHEKALVNSVARSINSVFGCQGSFNYFTIKQASKIYSYIFDLLLSIIIVSAKTVKAVKDLSKIEFEVLNNQVT